MAMLANKQVIEHLLCTLGEKKCKNQFRLYNNFTKAEPEVLSYATS